MKTWCSTEEFAAEPLEALSMVQSGAPVQVFDEDLGRVAVLLSSKEYSRLMSIVEPATVTTGPHPELLAALAAYTPDPEAPDYEYEDDEASAVAAE